MGVHFLDFVCWYGRVCVPGLCVLVWKGMCSWTLCAGMEGCVFLDFVSCYGRVCMSWTLCPGIEELCFLATWCSGREDMWSPYGTFNVYTICALPLNLFVLKLFL